MVDSIKQLKQALLTGAATQSEPDYRVRPGSQPELMQLIKDAK